MNAKFADTFSIGNDIPKVANLDTVNFSLSSVYFWSGLLNVIDQF